MSRPFALILPVYNFAAGLPATFTRLETWKSSTARDVQVVFVDDGSGDGSATRLDEFVRPRSAWCRLERHVKNKGKGAAVRTGVRSLGEAHDRVVISDCDLFYGLDIITDRLLPALDHCDVAIVDRSWDRRKSGGLSVRGLASGCFNRLVAVLTGVPFRDTQAGLKAFRMDVCAPLWDLQRIDGFAFDVELLSLASFYRMRIQQIPVATGSLTSEDSTSTVRLLPSAPRMIWDLLRVNYYWKAGRYGHALLEERINQEIARLSNPDRH